MTGRRTTACVLALLVSVTSAWAGTDTPKACPAEVDLTTADLYGLWRAEVDGRHDGTLLLEANPQWAGSLAGAINRNGVMARLAGDLDDGELLLEESADGQRITATWTGTPVAGRCGREIRGTRPADGGGPARPFVLQRPDRP